MMVPEIKTLLLDALKSGEYEKTTGVLARQKDEETVGYCCLGVLSDLASKRGVCKPFQKGLGDPDVHTIPANVYSIPETVVDEDGEYEEYSTALLPVSVEKWSGLDNSDQTALANINDETVGFDAVIEYIETNL